LGVCALATVAESAKRSAVAVYANFDMGLSLGFQG
jgi:hypothetical protein